MRLAAKTAIAAPGVLEDLAELGIDAKACDIYFDAPAHIAIFGPKTSGCPIAVHFHQIDQVHSGDPDLVMLGMMTVVFIMML